MCIHSNDVYYNINDARVSLCYVEPHVLQSKKLLIVSIIKTLKKAKQQYAFRPAHFGDN